MVFIKKYKGEQMMLKRLGQIRYIKNPFQIFRILTSRIKSIEVAVNYVCNRRCKGCYARNLQAEQKKLFMTPTQMKDICTKYKPAHINITGGEPMLNPNIYEIVKAVPKDIILSMVTNGDMFKNKDSTVDFNKLDKLKECGLNTIQISYGSNYDMDFVELLAIISKNRGLNVCLSCTNILKERENIKRAIQLGDWNKYHILFNTPGVGLEDVFDYQTYFTYRRHPLVREDNLFWAGTDTCAAGIKKFYITTEGSIYPCDRLLDEKYDDYETMRKEYSKKGKVYCRRYEKLCTGC